MNVKAKEITVCPVCKSQDFYKLKESIVCNFCKESYPIINNTAFLVRKNSDIRKEFTQILTKNKNKITKIFKTPSQRIWTKKSKKLIKKILVENNPDEHNKYVLNMGSGNEKFFRKIYSNYNELIRIGLPHDGKIDIYGDAMDFPVKDDSIDLLLSSSVMEHIENPEKCAAEIYRIIKPGGKIYFEIPFIRAYHMAPVDYQRYTIQGIEQLFKRHGFDMIEKGICSGPFNGIILLWIDFLISITPKGFKFITRFFWSWFLHPLKYLDRLVENRKSSNYTACNFYYYGRKPEK